MLKLNDRETELAEMEQWLKENSVSLLTYN